MLQYVEQYIVIMISCPMLPGQLLDTSLSLKLEVSLQELERTRARLQQAHDVGDFSRKGPRQVPKAFNFVVVCLKMLDYVGHISIISNDLEDSSRKPFTISLERSWTHIQFARGWYQPKARCQWKVDTRSSCPKRSALRSSAFHHACVKQLSFLLLSSNLDLSCFQDASMSRESEGFKGCSWAVAFTKKQKSAHNNLERSFEPCQTCTVHQRDLLQRETDVDLIKIQAPNAFKHLDSLTCASQRMQCVLGA